MGGGLRQSQHAKASENVANGQGKSACDRRRNLWSANVSDLEDGTSWLCAYNPAFRGERVSGFKGLRVDIVYFSGLQSWHLGLSRV